jgi:hypothetical protein
MQLGVSHRSKADQLRLTITLTFYTAAKAGLATPRLLVRSLLHASTAFARRLLALALVASTRLVMAKRTSATQV